MKILKNKLVMGTIILTLTGFVTRIIGFFYRIFISQSFGEEGMGIYQLIAPVMAFSFSLCCAGIQTAISKYVAEENSRQAQHNTIFILIISILLSCSLSILTAVVVYSWADIIAGCILLEPRTAPLLKILAFSFPLSAIHCCINGYYYGLKEAKIPAFLQLTEQIFRVGSVYLICFLFLKSNHTPPITLAVTGIVIGEASSTILSLLFILTRFYQFETTSDSLFQVIQQSGFLHFLPKIICMAAPLSLNRMIVNLLQSVEAIYIPEKLKQYGFSTSDALSIYGVLTGMALSLILFPCAVTNSISVLLLPIVSEAEGNGNKKKIAAAIRKSITWCTILGSICTILFFLFGKQAGLLLFHSDMAGEFVRGLSFICPFLYITSTLGSILHGLGKTFTTFLINILSLSIRIASIFWLVPRMGINGYLTGLLCGQLFAALACIFCLRKYRSF